MCILYIDIDECSEANEICVNGICTNYIGSFLCNCTNGFEGQNCNIAIGKSILLFYYMKVYMYIFVEEIRK